jgi:hypothetical protein
VEDFGGDPRSASWADVAVRGRRTQVGETEVRNVGLVEPELRSTETRMEAMRREDGTTETMVGLQEMTEMVTEVWTREASEEAIVDPTELGKPEKGNKEYGGTEEDTQKPESDEGMAHEEVEGGQTNVSVRDSPDKGRWMKEGNIHRSTQDRTEQGEMEVEKEDVAAENVCSPKKKTKLRTERPAEKSQERKWIRTRTMHSKTV